jgi:hypothetical protein
MTRNSMSPVIDEEVLRSGEKLLWVALVSSVIMIFALVKNSIAIFFPCLIASFWGGLSGISQVARGVNTNALVKYLALILAVVPGINLVAFIYFLIRTRGARQQAAADLMRQKALERSRERAKERRINDAGAAAIEKAPAQASMPSSSKANNERQFISKAIPSIKLAGLGGVPDGEQLRVSASQPGIELPESEEPVARAAKGEFGVFYFIDHGEHFSYVNMGQLRSAGITLDELHKAGLRNLKALIKDEKSKLRLVKQGSAYGLIMGGNFEASLMLVDELWDGAFKKYAPNGPIAAVPARDVCAFCDADSQEGIAELKRITERVWQNGDHLISDRLFLRKNGQWVAA